MTDRIGTMATNQDVADIKQYLYEVSVGQLTMAPRSFESDALSLIARIEADGVRIAELENDIGGLVDGRP